MDTKLTSINNPSFKCLVCSKLILLDEGQNLNLPVNRLKWSNGVVIEHYIGYTEVLDEENIIFGLCFACLKGETKNNRIFTNR